ncbi:hypothetical protein [Ornithinimicrobium sediminis]|uniref:hypothetical protein n=1 Tax=Ornithinimicrobium sediminis TaxID=2904603 RepID=UPI001E3F1F1C|nr:hypothetical protein [Ornithinimicrobium sediminis]MCE0486377.1 hypothetical protein [Ornithinimicrobium sediminis]
MKDHAGDGNSRQVKVEVTQPPPTRRLHHLCECGHYASEHPYKGLRKCHRHGCPCTVYNRTPLPVCKTCGHRASLHGSPERNPDGHCKALYCRCAAWAGDGHGSSSASVVVSIAGTAEIIINITVT